MDIFWSFSDFDEENGMFLKWIYYIEGHILCKTTCTKFCGTPIYPRIKTRNDNLRDTKRNDCRLTNVIDPRATIVHEL